MVRRFWAEALLPLVYSLTLRFAMGKGDFIAYFRDLAKDKKESNYNNWMSALKHLQDYTKKSDNSDTKRFCDIDLLWCERFKDYLLQKRRILFLIYYFSDLPAI